VYIEAMKRHRYIGDIPQYIKLYSLNPTGITVPRGYLQTVEDALIGKGNSITIVDNRILHRPLNIKSDIVLRPYQEAAKIDLFKHPNGMLVAPAGSGKTIMGLDIFATVKQKMLWLTHTNRLAEQVIERIVGTKHDGPAILDIVKNDIGIIGGGKKKIGDKITIGMVQTLTRNMDLLTSISQEFGLVILDECQHLPSSTFLKVVNRLPAYYLYSLTATPYRRDKLEGVMFATTGRPNAIIKREEVKKEKGIITPLVITRRIKSPIYDGNDFHYIVKELLTPNELRSDIIATDIINEAKQGNYCIAISTRKSYCEIIYNKVSKYWDKTGIATGDYSKKHNSLQVKRLENGEITVLVVTFQLLGEGFDVKKLNRGFIILPFKEKAMVEQAVGRIQRTCQGKNDGLLYEYLDEGIGILENQFRERKNIYYSLNMKVNE
jgi:superfamily II DNA or RNA helicase